MNDCKAGILTEELFGKGYAFVYDDDYIDSDLPAISATMPKSRKEYRDEYLFPFFTNMLPEGANRKVICRLNRIDEEDFFGILMAMAGKDTIGAVNLRPINKENRHDKN